VVNFRRSSTGPSAAFQAISKLQQRLSLFREGRFSELAELALASRAPNPLDHSSSALEWQDKATHRAEYILKTRRSAGAAAKALRTSAPAQTPRPSETLSVLRKLCPRAGIDFRPSSHLPRPPLTPPSHPRHFSARRFHFPRRRCTTQFIAQTLARLRDRMPHRSTLRVCWPTKTMTCGPTLRRASTWWRRAPSQTRSETYSPVEELWRSPKTTAECDQLWWEPPFAFADWPAPW